MHGNRDPPKEKAIPLSWQLMNGEWPNKIFQFKDSIIRP